MNFIKVINEVALTLITRENDISKWNKLQKDLWAKLVDDNIVERNNVDIFLKFAKFFYSFVEKNNKTPTIKQIKDVIGIK